MTILKSLIVESGKSARAIAKDLQISPSALSLYANGKRQISSEFVVQLSEYFNVPVEYILGIKKSTDDTPVDSNLSPDEKKLLEIFDSLDQEQQKQLLRLVQYTVSLNSK